jgi:DNA-binding NtrC family response regulator
MHSLFSVVSSIWHKRKPVRPTIVALLAEEHDRAMVLDLCHRSHWDVSLAGMWAEVHELIDRAGAQILFIDRDLAGSDWREAMSSCAASSSNGICIMLVSRVVDLYLWNEVVRNGGYEVLAKPLREDDVSRAIRLAWSYWSSARKSSAATKPVA